MVHVSPVLLPRAPSSLPQRPLEPCPLDYAAPNKAIAYGDIHLYLSIYIYIYTCILIYKYSYTIHQTRVLEPNQDLRSLLTWWGCHFMGGAGLWRLRARGESPRAVAQGRKKESGSWEGWGGDSGSYYYYYYDYPY